MAVWLIDAHEFLRHDMVSPRIGRRPVGASLMIIFLLIVLPSLSCNATGVSVQTTSWARIYGGPGFDQASQAIQTFDGGFIVAGYTTSFGAGLEDVWIIKLDSLGRAEWQKAYGGRGADLASAIQQTADGGYVVVAGHTDSFGPPAGSWVFRLDSNGSLLWQEKVREASSLQLTEDGGLIVSGGADTISKMDGVGNAIWARSFGRGYAYSVKQTSDGGYIVAGNNGIDGAGGLDAWIMKLDTTGNVVWQNTYGGSENDEAYSVEQTNDGGYIIAGYSGSFGGGFTDGWVFKLDASGNMIWQKAYGGRSQGAFSVLGSISKTQDGGFVLAGYTSGFGQGLNDGWVLKIDAQSNPQWQRTFGGLGYDAFGSIQQTSDGGFVVSGYLQTNPRVSDTTDAFVLKLDADGNIPHCHIMNTSSPVVTETNAIVATTTAAGADISSIITSTNATITSTSAVSRVLCLHP